MVPTLKVPPFHTSLETEKHIFRNALLKCHSIKLHPKKLQTTTVVMHVNASKTDLSPREAQTYVCSSHLRTAPTRAFHHSYIKPKRCMRKNSNSNIFPSIPHGQVSSIYCSWKGVRSTMPHLKD